MPKESIHQLTIHMPTVLFHRIKSVAKHMCHATITQFVKTTMLEKVEVLEAKQKAEEQAKKESRKARSLEKRAEERGFGTSVLSPVGPKGLEPQIVVQEDDDRDTAFYRHHAQRIFAVLDQPMEKRVRVAEALGAIKQRSPLTHPSDNAILARLETIILALRANTEEEAQSAPATPSILMQNKPTPPELQRLEKRLHEQDELIGQEIDTTKVASQGDTDDIP